MCQPGEAFAPLTIPLDVATGLCGLPEGEVAGVALEGIGLGADALKQVGAGVAGEFAVVGEAGDVEVDVAATLVGVALIYQGFDDGQHLGYVLAGPREYVGGHDVQAGLIAVEAAGVELGDFLDGLTLGEGGEDHLVAAGLHQLLAHVPDVGDVLDVVHLKTVVHEGPADPVGHHVGPEVADVGVPIHSWPTGVHTNLARLCGLDLVYTLGEGVVDTQHASL